MLMCSSVEDRIKTQRKRNRESHEALKITSQGKTTYEQWVVPQEGTIVELF